MIIKSILKEELKNSLRMKKNYEKELRKLPKGSLHAQKIKGHKYYYLHIREKKRVKRIYKGKPNKETIAKYKEVKKMRAKYRNLLSKTKKQIAYLKGALRGKERL